MVFFLGLVFLTGRCTTILALCVKHDDIYEGSSSLEHAVVGFDNVTNLNHGEGSAAKHDGFASARDVIGLNF